jgi:general secretion pathway protein L
MSHKLLIRLKNTATETYSMDWMIFGNKVLGNKADVLHSSSKNGSDELANIAKNIHNIIVLVPGEDVLLTHVKLPKLSRSRLAKAIPYALEDQLTEDPSILHFSVGKAKVGALLPVAVVNKDKMIAWQSFLSTVLKEANQQVSVFLPDVLALPLPADSFYVLIDQGLAWVRTGTSAGFVIETAGLFTMLQLILKKEAPSLPRLIHIDVPDAMVVLTEEQIAQLGVPVNVSVAKVQPLALMAPALEGPCPMNLLQGEFLPSFKKVTLNQLVGLAFAIAGAWFVVITLANIIHIVFLQREKTALDEEMTALYHVVYPTSSLPSRPEVRLQKELSTLQAGQADSTFVRLIKMIGSDIGPLLSTKLTVKTMTFRDNQLILEIEAKELIVVDKLRQSLGSRGLKAVVSNSERSADGLVETRLTVEEMP